MKLMILCAFIIVASGCSAPTLLYVTSTDGNLAVIDVDALRTKTTFNISGGPWGITSSPGRARVYVANFWGKSVVGIDTKTNTIAEKTNCDFPWGIAVKP